jgi:hypothetical protein
MTETQQHQDCIACGMPMEDAADHAQGDPGKRYCRYCATPSGAMQSYEERLEKYSTWLMQSQGLSKTSAIKEAETILAGLPAWRDRAEKK